LPLGTDSETLLLPLDVHLDEDGINSAVVLFQVDHPDFLVFILEEQILLVRAEIKIVDLMFEVIKLKKIVFFADFKYVDYICGFFGAHFDTQSQVELIFR
jgi:hypothetical protein